MNSRHGKLRAAAAVFVLAALGFSGTPDLRGEAGPASRGAHQAGQTPVARGMLIPARIRLMVRFNPSRTA